MGRGFDELVGEAEAEPVEGWDFSWFEGRATECRPSWGYQRILGQRLATVSSALDIDTGGGEVLAGVPGMPERMVATESWPPNVVVARRNLGPRGVDVVYADGAPLPFPDASFELIGCRHPVDPMWTEVARLLEPGGTYLSQQIGDRSVGALTDWFLGAQPGNEVPDVDRTRAAAERVGLELLDLRAESLRMEFFDIGAVVYFLRKVIWIVPGFGVDRYRDELRELDRRIREAGPFVAWSRRILVEARKR